jgi:hypothetical protein
VEEQRLTALHRASAAVLDIKGCERFTENVETWTTVSGIRQTHRRRSWSPQIMIANSAFLAAIVLAVLCFLLLEQLSFLVPYRRFILTNYLWHIVAGLVVVFLNLFALFYAINRRLFLKDTGRKLAHVEQQLRTPDTIVRDLSERLSRDA